MTDASSPPPVALHSETSGAGHPLILLHGLFGSLSNWRPVSRVLSAHFHVVNVDQRNHGRSPHHDTFSYPALAEDLRALLASQSLNSAFVLGHSLGGKTAMQFALAYPQCVDKLIVVDMPPLANPPRHEEILAALNALDLSASRDRRTLDAQLAPRIPDAAVRQFLLMNVMNGADGGLQWRMNLSAFTRCYPEILRAVTLPSGGTPFAKPALFVRGERSDYVRDEDMTAIRALFPQAQLVTVAGAGHWVHADAPEEFARLVLDFLGA